MVSVPNLSLAFDHYFKEGYGIHAGCGHYNSHFTSVVLALYSLEVDYNQPAVVQGLMMPDSVCAVTES